MNPAQKIAITGSAFFFIVGLLTGIWKYISIVRSENATAPAYVDILHRATLLYAFACGVLFQLAELSVYSESTNLYATVAVVSFFVLANIPYALHAILNDTENQFSVPYKLGSIPIPKLLVHGFMVLLIAAELGGALVLVAGALKHIWS